MGGDRQAVWCILCVDMCALRFVQLDADLLPAIEPWFDDPETIRFLGGRDWIRRELQLVKTAQTPELRDRKVEGREAWIAFEECAPVGFIGVERYDDGRAACVIVVDPSVRRKGIGRAILEDVWQRPEMSRVQQLDTGVEPDNVASQSCVIAAGFTLSPTPDEEGMLHAVRARPPRRC